MPARISEADLNAGQPYHGGERYMQHLHGSVTTSNEFGPIIYHKLIPGPFMDMVDRQPHFMVCFWDAEHELLWPSALFGVPGFADPYASKGKRIDFATGLDPRDGALVSGALKEGTLVGGVQIDFTNRRRNRFNGVVTNVQNGTGDHDTEALKQARFSMEITQAFGNCPKYITRRRAEDVPTPTTIGFASLQADYRQRQLQLAAEHPAVQTKVEPLRPHQINLITQTDLIYLASVNPGANDYSEGCDMNSRGGDPGFMRVINGGRAICWPDYVGNGMYMSLGNIHANRSAGVLVVDWDGKDGGRALQLVGSARLLERSAILKGNEHENGVNDNPEQAELAAILSEEPQALRLIVLDLAVVRDVPHYLPHRYRTVELSPYNPKRVGADSNQPQTRAILQWSKPANESGSIRTFEFQLARVPRPGTVILRSGQHVRLRIPHITDRSTGQPPERTWTVTSDPNWFSVHGRFQITVRNAGEEKGFVSPWLHTTAKDTEDRPYDPLRAVEFLGFSGEFSPLLDAAQDFEGYVPPSALPDTLIWFTGGVGITPALAFLSCLSWYFEYELGKHKAQDVSLKTVTLFHSAATLEDVARLSDLASAKVRLAECGIRLRVVLNLTRAKELPKAVQEDSVLSQMTVHQGRLNGDQLKSGLDGVQGKEMRIFLCGPKPFELGVQQLMDVTPVLKGKPLETESFAY
eukprot:Clim_evm25s169 gene=Clim_evmTU25s169